MLDCSRRLVKFVLAIGIVSIFVSAPALADKRVALVIGNGAYRNAPRLPNPTNDAQDVAAALKRVGFETILGLDLDRDGMEDSAVRFSRAARDADVTLFYYSGHAMQFAGVNYLMPVDAKLTDEADLRRLTKVDDIVADLQQAKSLRILVLDSCRDNPLADALRSSVAHRGIGGMSRGLAKIDSPLGMIVAYATQAGRTAADGTGRNSPFTTAFLKDVEARDEIGTVFRRIATDVYETTGHEQLPELSLSLIGEFYLGGRPQLDAAKAGAAAQAWAIVKDTTSVAMLDTFIREYGDSMYGSFARARRDELSKNQVALAKPETPAAPSDRTPKAATPRLTRADVTARFAILGKILERVRTDYVEQPDESRLLRSGIDRMRTAFPASGAVASTGPVPSGAAANAAHADLNAVYDAALGILNSRASDSDDGRVVQVAIQGMLAALDPHSSYMEPKEFADMQTQSRGVFGGLGIEVTLADGLIKVVSPIDDTPASKAGLRSGDLITHLDGAPVQGLTLNQAVDKMRGAVGSVLTLTIVREGQDKPFGLSLTRETIHVRAVRSHVDGGDVGYIRISQFNEQTTDDLKSAIADITKQGGARLKGYVVDLRNNPGGLLDQVISVSDQFLNSGAIVSTRGRKPDDTTRYSAKAGDATNRKPIVVLINGGTASGAEIMAGALQDNKRATLLGTRSFGKGTLQTIIPLGASDGALRLTTALYYTPSGRSIQAKGIDPNIESRQDASGEVNAPTDKGEAALNGHLKADGSEQTGSQSYVPADPKNDIALNLALDLMRGAKTNPAFPPK